MALAKLARPCLTKTQPLHRVEFSNVACCIHAEYSPDVSATVTGQIQGQRLRSLHATLACCVVWVCGSGFDSGMIAIGQKQFFVPSFAMSEVIFFNSRCASRSEKLDRSQQHPNSFFLCSEPVDVLRDRTGGNYL